ncbi:MAG TPA: 2,3-bisphosphoglycerate-independent phosphoglycerate mutase [bacterium]|nr:2,3-bisphosphoglycerate-independent phosphoglycerate mutase [bacterium]
MADNKVLLIILDGWGLNASENGNAPLLAKTPVLDSVYATYPKTSLSAAGLEVGLSTGEPGNSEVGHLNIGSGRVVWENLPRIDQAIESGQFASNKNMITVFDHVKKNGSTLQLVGLVSDGGVHSHIRHLQEIIRLAAENGVKSIAVHFISDGRDSDPEGGAGYAATLEKTFAMAKVGKIATIVGRYFAMDRDKNWDREKKAFDVMIKGVGGHADSAKEAFEASYKAKKTDEFLEPVVLGEGAPFGEKDAILFFNHRSDRMRQMLSLFEKFKEGNPGVFVASMTQYYREQISPVIFSPVNLENTVSEIVSAVSMNQLHTAETEKFAHVTYFFRGGKETSPKKEVDTIIPSKKVPTYDQLPGMSAEEVTKIVLEGIAKNTDFIVVNYANGDMVGHTGVLKAAIEACEIVDGCLGEVLPAASKAGYKVFITADHGNCEVMKDESTGKPNTEHTSNPVPFVYLDFIKRPFEAAAIFSNEDYFQYAAATPIGVLADIAPSILANLGVDKPEEMSGMDLSVAML